MGDLIERQAAIDALKDAINDSVVLTIQGDMYSHNDNYFGLEVALSIIQKLPSAQPEPCEDAVSRKLMYELGATCMARRDENGELVALGSLDALPSAQPTEASCWGCNCPKMERLKEQKTFSKMVHLHDETHGVCLDTIDRQAAIDAVSRECLEFRGIFARCEKNLKDLPSAQPKIVQCKDCLMHGVCRFEQGLGLDGYCSQAERRTDD